jgi:hypothetical protein
MISLYLLFVGLEVKKVVEVATAADRICLVPRA